MRAILADVYVETHRGGGFEWDLLHLLIVLLICVGAVAVAVIILKVLGWTIPQWVWQILGIVAAVVVGVIALKFLWSLF